MKYLLILTIISNFGSTASIAAEKNKKTLVTIPAKKVEVPIEVPKPIKAIPTHTLNDLDRNCLNSGSNECRTKEGAKCELLIQLDSDSTPNTFIAENKYKKCESYWVTEQCRILGADICDSEQKVKLFGPAPIVEPSFFDSIL